MSESYRGGNSRLLAKTLDQLGHPMAVLDRGGKIAFANAALCELVKADATLLVGQQCSWQIAADDQPFASLMTALAPPVGTMRGRLVARQLTTPVVFGSTHTGQLFVPLLDDDGSVEATLVVLGKWDELLAQLPRTESLTPADKRGQAASLAQIRSRWQTLDGLHALVGSSPVAQLAMVRAQLAITHNCSVLVVGPRGSGKTDIVRGVFTGRLKKAGLAKVAGQFFPVNCGLLEAELLVGMLDVLASRLRSDASAASQLLLLEQVDQLSEAGVQTVEGWLDNHGDQCTVAATSRLSSQQLAQHNPAWCKLISRLSAVEIALPPLAERRQDIPLLATELLAFSCAAQSRAPLSLSSEALQLLTAFPWPGNLAELAQAMQEAVKHAVLVASIQVSHLPVAIRTFASTHQSPAAGRVEPLDLDQVLQDVERTMIQRALKLSPRNRAQAARWLGISRARLLRRIEQLGLTTP